MEEITACGLQAGKSSISTRTAGRRNDRFSDSKTKDLPIEIRQESIAAMDYVCDGRTQEPVATVSLMFDSMRDAEINIMAHSILNMYDAATRYPPIAYSVRAPSISYR